MPEWSSSGGGVIGCAVLREFARRGIPGHSDRGGAGPRRGRLEGQQCHPPHGLRLEAGHDRVDDAATSGRAVADGARRARVSRSCRWARLMLAHSADDARRLTTEIAANASDLGVATELLDRAAVRDVAPFLADDVDCRAFDPRRRRPRPLLADARVRGRGDRGRRRAAPGSRRGPPRAVGRQRHRSACRRVDDRGGAGRQRGRPARRRGRRA